MTLLLGDPENVVNTPLLVHHLAEVAREIRALKAALRTTWTTPMHKQQSELCALKKRATLLCALRAATRGRLHIATRPTRGIGPSEDFEPRAYNLRLAQAALDRFELARSVPSVAVRGAQ